MEGTSLLSLPEGMRIEQIQMTENGLVIVVVANHHHRSIAIITGSCVMLLVQAARSSFSSPFAHSPAERVTVPGKSSRSGSQTLWSRGPG